MGSNRIGLIIGREYKAIVWTKSFIVMTILMPVLTIGCMVLPTVLMMSSTGDHEHIAVIDETGRYFNALEDSEEFDFEDITPIGRGSMQDFFNATSHTYAVVLIPADIDSTLRLTVYSNSAVRTSLSRHIEQCLSNAVSETRIEAFNIPELKAAIEQCDVSVDVGSVQWKPDGGEERSSAEMATILGLILSMLSYIFVMIYGAMIMSSVIEEKTNRIVEVMVSSCRPIELMLGKIIGVALAGVTQIAFWVVIGTVLASILGIGAFASGAIDAGAVSQVSQDVDSGTLAEAVELLATINYPKIIISFLLFFIGGYLLYAALFAALGSAVDQQSEASQFMAPVMIVMVFSLMVGIACADNPNGDLAVWCSMIPFTSSIVMMIRLPYDVPVWQLLASFALLYATAIGITALAARVYRTGILMYGQKASFKALLKWLK